MDGFMESTKPDKSPVEVTAVFLNCEVADTEKDPDSENSRFEREELFKHNALRNCDKKLALTVKLSSASANSADEYVPIDHVVDGRSQRRVRLLNPYVLRLRRDTPLEAYKLRFIERDTREPSDVADSEDVFKLGLGRDMPARASYSPPQTGALLPGPMASRDCSESEAKKNWASKLTKRHEKNIVIEKVGDESTIKNTNSMKNYEDDKFDRKIQSEKNSPEFRFTMGTGEVKSIQENNKIKVRKLKTMLKSNKKHEILRFQPEQTFHENDIMDESEKEFALYEIENPILWFNVHVNLFEKLSTPKGNTLWNDITKGESVSVSSMAPDWSDSDIITVHYKPVDFVPRENFLLPNTRMCLLVPLVEDNMDSVPNTETYALAKNTNYILIPAEDVLDIDINSKAKRTPVNVSDDDINEGRRRVVVRITKALWDVMEDKLTIVDQGSDKYLTLVHRGKRHAQIDLEIRADDNQLVHVRARIRECDSGLLGSEQQESGVLSAPVLLPPRHTRRLRLLLPGALPADLHHCTVYLLNGNDESVAVRDAVIKKEDQCFCVWHCDCVCFGDDPKLLCREMSAARQSAAGLPSRRGSRCARACQYTDATVVDLAVVVVGVLGMLLIFGVVKGFLGLLCPWVGVWGLDCILQSPRKLDCYYESALRGRKVVYDDQYWPVHPDTCKRTVRVVSLPIEFILNVVFFIVTPGLIVVEAFKKVTNKKRPAESSRKKSKLPKCTKKKKNVSRNMQVHAARSRGRLARRSWMTPGAKELSEHLWTDPTTPTGLNARKCMLPLLREDGLRQQIDPSLTSASDSEQEDTAFVLMHMQKSTDSLARNQMKPDVACIDCVQEQQEQPAIQPASDIRRS